MRPRIRLYICLCVRLDLRMLLSSCEAGTGSLDPRSRGTLALEGKQGLCSWLHYSAKGPARSPGLGWIGAPEAHLPWQSESQCCGLRLVCACLETAVAPPCSSPSPQDCPGQVLGSGRPSTAQLEGSRPAPASPARSLLLLCTSTLKWLQQPLAPGSALHL